MPDLVNRSVREIQLNAENNLHRKLANERAHEITRLQGKLQAVNAALAAHIEVIAMTHANGYGHWNPWDDCDHPTCTAARDLRMAAGNA